MLTSRSRIQLVVTLISALVAAVALAACGDDPPDSAEDGVRVVATTTQVADLAQNVAGDRAQVTGLLATNSDPHDYEPTSSDAEAVAEADVVFVSGGDLDQWVDQVVESSGTDAPVIALLDSVDPIPGEGEVDPHWWQDPANAVLAVERIRAGLTDVDPEGAAAFTRNARIYAAQLEALDEAIAACIDSLPAAQRKLVTSHDALGYYADRYGIETIGAAIPALTTQAQASAGDTAELIDLIEAEHVNAIFPEAGVSAELEQAIAAETGARVGGELWADTLGPQGSSGATYIEAMAANTAALVDGMSGGAERCDIDLAAL